MAQKEAVLNEHILQLMQGMARNAERLIFVMQLILPILACNIANVPHVYYAVALL